MSTAPDSGTYALILSADDAYARALAVAAWSTLAHWSDTARLRIYVLDHGFSAQSRDRLEQVVEATNGDAQLCWVTIPSGRLDAIDDTRFTVASYARLLIPELLPANVERAVYLDCDVLVNHDISPLFTMPIADAQVAAVRDVAILSTADQHSGVRDPSPPRPYFNAGVLVMNLAQWRLSGLGERALEYCASGDDGPPPWADQDALNALVERWHELEPMWNFQHPRFFRDAPPQPGDFRAAIYDQRWELLRGAAVLHFTGQKPWYGSCTTAGTREWVRALASSGWYSRAEMARWLAGFVRERARYRAGTLRLNVRRRIGRWV